MVCFVSCCISHRVRRAPLLWGGEMFEGSISIDSGLVLSIEFRLLELLHVRMRSQATVMWTAVSGK